MLSQTFPAKHPRHGEPTFFKDKIHAAITHNDEYWNKLHTMRSNYDLWSKRFQKIYEGKACLSLRVWSGKPYHSKQIEIARLTKEDGIGLQRLEFYNGCLQQPILSSGRTINAELVAKNDGLPFESWKDWFRNSDTSKPLAIIHFTKFRY